MRANGYGSPRCTHGQSGPGAGRGRRPARRHRGRRLWGGQLAAIGSIRAAQWDGSPPPPEFCDPRVSGGLEVDCGVHEFDLARWLLGAEVEAVTSCGPEPSHDLAAVGDVDTVHGLARLS